MHNKIVDKPLKIDLHIHSIASNYKEEKDYLNDSTIDNIDILLKLEFLLDIAQYYNLINISDKLMSIMVLNNLNGDNNV